MITYLLLLVFRVSFCLHSVSWTLFHFPFIIDTHGSIRKFRWQMSLHYTAPGPYHWSLLISYLTAQNLEDSPRYLHLICCTWFYVCKSCNLWSVTMIPLSLQMQWKYNCSTTFLDIEYANTNRTRCVISSKKSSTPIFYILKHFITCPIIIASMLPSTLAR
jgi:hypothetical protein